jgi:CRISPR-associated protein (TIGR03986 family)
MGKKEKKKEGWKSMNSLFSGQGPTPGNEKGKNNYHEKQKNTGKKNLHFARAPYNFIPLNNKVVPSDTTIDEIDHSKYCDGKYTGFITLNITTETPLYIRDTLTAADMEKEDEIKDKNKKNNTKFKYINSDFFSPGGKIRIPGSSLRGMIRNLVEIVSYSNLKFFEEKRKYHFRSFADRSLDFRDEYKRKMIGEEGTGSYLKNLRAGYLIKDGIEYKIIPAQKVSNRQFFRVKEDIAIDKGILIKQQRMCFRKDGNYNDNKKYKMGFKRIKFKVNASGDKDKLTEIFDENAKIQGAYEGCLVLSGWMRGPTKGPKKNPRGKSSHWVIGPAGSDTLEFAEGVIDGYKNDDNRHEEANLLRYLKKNPGIKVPCFYVERDEKVISFGHTGLFRLAYEQNLKDLIPEGMKGFKGIDIAEAIFGNEKDFSGRVFFEDSYLHGDQSKALTEETVIKILAKPNPTTFQHYLRQEAERIEPLFNNYRGIDNYNSPGAQLAGYKLYWHRSDNKEWEETSISFHEKDFEKLIKGRNQKDFEPAMERKKGKVWINLKKLDKKLRHLIINAVGLYETQHTRIKAVKKGETFIGKIRFENLSKVELGALLFALDLPKGHCHKIGMGKPLGLGSIQITPELHLSKRHERYTKLFEEWENPIPETTDISEYKEAFEQYVIGQIGESNNQSLWDTNRLRELKTMLDFENKPDDSKTAYMELEQFRNRNILPKPTEVKNL